MDETKESTFREEPQQLPETVAEPYPQSRAEQKSGLAQRVLQVKASAYAHSQRAIQLVDTWISEPEAQEPKERITPQAAFAQLEALAREEGIPSTEFILRSKQALQTSAWLRKQTMSDQRTLEEQVFSYQRNIREIDKRMRELDQVKGFKRIQAALEKRRLERQKASAQRQINQLILQVGAKRQLLEQISKQEEPIRQRQEEIVLTEIGEEIKTIRSKYEKLKREIQDGAITAEIRKAYIQQVITPQVDQIVEERRLPASRKEAFYEALRTYLEHRGEPEAQREPFRQKLDSFFTYEAGFYGVKYYCEPLLKGGDKTVVQDLIAKMAARDIGAVKAVVESKLGDDHDNHDKRRKFSDILKGAGITARWGDEEGSLGDLIFRRLSIPTWGDYLPDMRLWQTMKASKAVNEIFGEIIRQQDEEYYTVALGKSLSDRDGYYIEVLYYYPTPEAIRNLVLLAAANVENYRTSHANHVLTMLARQPDWNQILDQAEAAYPLLKNARSLLISWNWDEYGNQPDIQPAAGDLALSLFENPATDPELRELATAALPNQLILDILARRDVISSSEAGVIKEAEELLKKLNQETREKHRQSNYSIPHISDDSFRQGLRKNLFKLLQSKPGELDEQQAEIIKRFGVLSRLVLENQQDYQALSYLTSGEVLKKLQDPSLKPADVTIFLEAYKTVPGLASSGELLLREFCRQYEGEQSVSLFKDMTEAYQGQEQQLIEIISLVGKNILSKERALELPTKAKSVLASPLFELAVKSPRLFLETEEGLEFLTQISSGNLFSLEKDLSTIIGKRILTLKGEGDLQSFKWLIEIVSPEIRWIDKLLSSGSIAEVGQLDWQRLLMGFVRSQSEVRLLPNLSQVSVDTINTLFSDPKVRDRCLEGLRGLWITYLESGKPEEIPFSLIMMSEYIKYCGGTGPLNQINSLNTLINSVISAFSSKTTSERTKLEISQGLLLIEEGFARRRWSNEDRTNFYNISQDILGVAPSIFSDFLSIFKQLTPSQMRQFVNEIYPLYRVWLVSMERRDSEGKISYDKRELVQLRKEIRNFANILDVGEKPFETQKKRLLEKICNLFKDRFGIIKTPESFSLEQIRSFRNVLIYLGNLKMRNQEKETILGFYLSLMVNNRWDDFRRGEEINPDDYLVPEKSEYIKRFLKERKRVNPLTSENLGIPQEDMPEFLKILQQETQNIVIGDIETVDVKLKNIILNLRGLEDLDLYTDAMDKRRMEILLKWGNKKVGAVVAKMYQQLVNPAKTMPLSEEERRIQSEIKRIIQEAGLTLSPETLKEHFQDGIKPLATVVNLIRFIEDTRAEQEIESLRRMLEPSAEVIEVFRKLGEEFTPTSGAMALSQNLSYLDNLVVKREDELEPEEKALVTEYIAKIRDQLVKLESIYDQIKNKFRGLRQLKTTSTNPLLSEKLDQIDRIVNEQVAPQVITSIFTNDLNIIIENIRECLSCTKKGSNNDTNLTFGDMNKFYLFSRTEAQEGSISDQIVFVEPITRANGSQGIAFILDRVYGKNTPTILENQIEAVLKKLRSIKQRFPNARIFVFIPNSTISTGGISADMLLERFKAKNILGQAETIEVNVAESPAGDHYVEFGGNSRAAGKRLVNGVILET